MLEIAPNKIAEDFHIRLNKFFLKENDEMKVFITMRHVCIYFNALSIILIDFPSLYASQMYFAYFSLTKEKMK
jgi:hypothetical protein